MISSLANYRPFFRSFRYIPPSGDLCHVSSLVCKTRQHRLSSAKCLFAQKLGPNLSEMEVRTFLRIKKVIWDQLLAFQAEIIKGKLLPTTLRSAEFTKIGLSSPQTKREDMRFWWSAILCCCVVLGLLVLKSVVLDLALCVSFMFCLENIHHISCIQLYFSFACANPTRHVNE